VRGATIRNIEDFERDYPDATTILLEQNYRSTQNILTAATRHRLQHPVVPPARPIVRRRARIRVEPLRSAAYPVVRDLVVDRSALDRITRELAAVVTGLVDAARAGRIAPADLTGSSVTVSNFGPLGLDDGVPVINHPEAAILGMGAIRPRAVVVDGALAVRSTMRLTCAFDHRVADGAQVAAFLVALRELIEEPDLALAEL
ncbi:2-oxo acid dehydrogenase subunit E2, partial [Mycolicibacterium insubricum]|uniref:2-oxo acid dehydrogenase subunit E2 n=1 Tax=Mycolicibacterium insubricum TaxID=444597 RepID=UPI0021F29AE3